MRSFRYVDRTEGDARIGRLEVNIRPASETSPVPEPAAFAGIPFEELVRWMVEDASLNR